MPKVDTFSAADPEAVLRLRPDYLVRFDRTKVDIHFMIWVALISSNDLRTTEVIV